MQDPRTLSDGALIARADRRHVRICSEQLDQQRDFVHIDGRRLWQRDGCRDMAGWIAARYGYSPWEARRWTAAAHSLEGLTRVSDALSQGKLSLPKVLELARFATPETEKKLISWSKRISPRAIRRRADRETRPDPEDAKEAERTRFVRSSFFDQRTEIEGRLPAAQGAAIAKAIQRLAGPDDGSTWAELDRGVVLDPSVGRRLTCDARLQFVLTDADGNPLGIGRTSREVPLRPNGRPFDPGPESSRTAPHHRSTKRRRHEGRASGPNLAVADLILGRFPTPRPNAVDRSGGSLVWWPMPAETVTAQPKGLELFGAGPRERALRLTGKKGDALTKLGIGSVQDLLQHYPRYHVDRTNLRTIRELKQLATEQDLGEVQVHGVVKKLNRPFKTRSGKLMITGTIGDETGSISVTWFNQQWVMRALSPGTEAFFYGKMREYRGKMQMSSPRFELLRTGKEPFNVGRIIPIYPATADLSSDQLRRLMWDAFRSIDDVVDPVPDALRKRFRLMGRADALRLIHFPDEKDDVINARKRLVFDELFTLQLGLVYRKRKLERTVQGVKHVAPTEDSLAEVFVNALPFELTSAQRRACDEVAGDMVKTYPMHRLLEGEVGSGKTVVALFGCLIAIDGGHQSAFMAPTEVLAEQHHLTVKELLDRAFGEDEATNLFAGISKRPVVRLLTGSTPSAERSSTLAGVASGDVDLLIGTHALIQEAIEFRDLGVAVVDEQHRFGVHQRKALREKGAGGEPDILVMTATPIPRTLAVTIYGDLDISILDELPKGRRPIKTSIAVGDEGRDRVYDLIRAEVNAGRQAFIVYALRDESDKVELRSAKSEARRLAEDVFPDLQVGLVHGDMKADEKEGAMTAFRDGKTDVLVATTVIEVGVDVPNATVMLVESAERFGLAQLHQLRGRIGRGEHASYCVLATDVDLDNPEGDATVALAAERLEAVAHTTDGFKLAMTDLRHRGEGQLFGARQSGMPQLKMARVLEHEDMIKAARDAAVELLDEDPELRGYEHIALEREMRDRFPDQALDVVQSG